MIVVATIQIHDSVEKFKITFDLQHILFVYSSVSHDAPCLSFASNTRNTIKPHARKLIARKTEENKGPIVFHAAGRHPS